MAIAGTKSSPVVRKKEPIQQVNGLFPSVTAVTPQHNDKNASGVIVKDAITPVQKPERTNVVDTKFIPLSHLVVHTSGDPWKVNYYRQLLGISDAKTSLQLGKLPATQSYEEIKNFIIKVTEPLDGSQDEETKEFTVTGAAGVEYGVNANEGDMFTADMGNGKTGLFVVTSSVRKMYNKLALYDIRYELVTEFIDGWVTDLNNKIARTFYFEKSLIENYSNPFVTEDDHQLYKQLTEYSYQLKEFFINRFWCKQANSIAIPHNEDKSILRYDGYHANYCRSIGINDHTNPITVYQNGLLAVNTPTTVWDALLEMSVFPLPFVHKEFTLVSKDNFKTLPAARSIAWSCYSDTMYPKGSVDSADYHQELIGKLLSPVSESDKVEYLPEKLSNTFNLNNVPMYHSAAKDSFYVFTEAFYNQDKANMSVLEILTIDMLNGGPISSAVLIEMIKNLLTRDYLDQYYFIPVILTMVQYNLRSN